MEMRLEHIGIVVKDIEHSKEYYMKTYGCKPLSGVVYEPAHNVNVLFLDAGHGRMPMIELIMPIDENSRVSNFLKKTGGGLHHLAYEVENIEKAIEHFKSLRAMILNSIVLGAGHGNTRTVWLYTSEKDLVELIEKQDG
ncbi:MAG: VOC family protein [bacterium]